MKNKLKSIIESIGLPSSLADSTSYYILLEDDYIQIEINPIHGVTEVRATIRRINSYRDITHPGIYVHAISIFPLLPKIMDVLGIKNKYIYNATISDLTESHFCIKIYLKNEITHGILFSKEELNNIYNIDLPTPLSQEEKKDIIIRQKEIYDAYAERYINYTSAQYSFNIQNIENITTTPIESFLSGSVVTAATSI